MDFLIPFGSGVLVTLIVEVIIAALVIRYDAKLDKKEGEK